MEYTLKPVTYFAFACTPKDEKVLIQRVNAYLATFKRTTSKAKQPSLLEGYLPFVLKHFYWNLNKDAGTWFDIYPNQDARGEFFFPEFKDRAWLMHVRIDLQNWTSATQEKADAFISGVIAAIAFDCKVIKEEQL